LSLRESILLLYALIMADYLGYRNRQIIKSIIMQTTKNQLRQLSERLLLFTFCLFVILFQSCKKMVQPSDPGESGTKAGEVTGKKKPNPHDPPPPPPPPTFYFFNCNNPTYSASFNVTVPANTPITKNYVNSPGGSYAAFTSATVNGITISAPAGTFNVGSGSVVFTATGTPISTGFFNVVISLGNIQPCTMYFTVTNAPVSGPTVDPGPTPGSTGVVNFNYKGQSVAYKTVRAKDGKIWLQQNLGSPQVAFHHNDEASYGDYFQWGRWDDGHQVPNSPTTTGGPTLLNPSHISSGNPNFISGTPSAGTGWWGSGGLSTDTWAGSSATSTNGKDPCTALGTGWRLPSAADWQNVKNSLEDLEGAMAAFMSNLKLPASGFRAGYGGFVFRNGEGNYWSSTGSNIYALGLTTSDNTYSAVLQPTERGQGYSCRCLKD
jgi:uncharacterized protein (TIGR02145 family)